MTILQLKVCMAIKKYGSISSAAKELELSQPNASNYIKSLENEIGFAIFNRSKSGTIITEKGQAFLEHAAKLMEEHDTIMSINKMEEIYRLRIGITNYTTAIEPFLKLCEKHKDDKVCDLKYLSVSIEEGLNQLDNYNLDLVFTAILKSQVAGLKANCKKYNLIGIPICEFPASINLRKDHPAIKEGKCFNITQGSDAMKDYPYVSYRNFYEDNSSTGYNDSNFVQSSYNIIVDGIDVRLRVLSCTNGFSFGVMPSIRTSEKYNLASFPVPGIKLEVFCISRKTDKSKKEILEYIELLKEELHLNN